MGMQQKLKQVLKGKEENYIFPFFWQHGEAEAVLREYMEAIYESNIRAVCVESRPHPDFLGDLWWHDMDIILDEALQRGMKVWVLDDEHFPSGYAAGAICQADMELSHQYLDYNACGICGPQPEMVLDVAQYAKPQPMPPWLAREEKDTVKREDDHLFRVLACKVLERGLDGDAVDLTDEVRDGVLRWNVPEGYWKIYIIYLTRDAKGRNDYINFLDRNSCRLFIDTVYEQHYAHYKQYFGTVIAGFFSDGPPIGNTPGYTGDDLIGKPDMPLPWSGDMEAMMDQEFGDREWRKYLNCLWSESENEHLTARMRTAYMNAVTKLVSDCFSNQIGEWCEKHGVEYIVQMVEVCDSSALVGPSMGHYFRGLSGQHMAGIDNIGGQVAPGEQDLPRQMLYPCQDSAGFFHYMLGRMGASLGAIDPRKKGRCMCENFGAYGWKMGVRTEKYLTDHFLARGVNHFVPHAFSPKQFPDWDCPPHFYAHGENPQYRAFGHLMAYTNRVCHLISGGHDAAAVALLYHGESQWAGEFESNVCASRVLTENQINFLLVPADVFENREYYRTGFDAEKKILFINGLKLRALVVSGCEFITKPVAEFVLYAKKYDFPVIFTGRIPKGISDVPEEESLTYIQRMKGARVVPVNKLADEFEAFPLRTALPEKPERFLTVYHYENDGDVYLIQNEDAGKVFDQWITLPQTKDFVRYDAWENRVIPMETRRNGRYIQVHVKLEPLEMAILISADARSDIDGKIKLSVASGCEKSTACQMELKNFVVSKCESREYPDFSDEHRTEILHSMAEEYPNFSGYYRYETIIYADRWENAVLSIEDAYEGVEVFVNDKPIGMRIARPYQFELGNLDGETQVAIEVATTLERKVKAMGVDNFDVGLPSPMQPTGIVGKVRISFEK